MPYWFGLQDHVTSWLVKVFLWTSRKHQLITGTEIKISLVQFQHFFEWIVLDRCQFFERKEIARVGWAT